MQLHNLELYKEYPYIAAWNTFTGSGDYYIIRLIQLAKEQQAPKNSIYKDETGWVTIDGCKNQSALVYIGKYVSILTQE